MTPTLLDFSFSLSKRQKIVAAEESENEKEVLSIEDDGRQAEYVSLDASVSFRQFEKVQTSWLANRCLVLPFGPQASS